MPIKPAGKQFLTTFRVLNTVPALAYLLERGPTFVIGQPVSLFFVESSVSNVQEKKGRYYAYIDLSTYEHFNEAGRALVVDNSCTIDGRFCGTLYPPTDPTVAFGGESYIIPLNHRNVRDVEKLRTTVVTEFDRWDKNLE